MLWEYDYERWQVTIWQETAAAYFKAYTAISLGNEENHENRPRV
jgi:hypothetical protein